MSEWVKVPGFVAWASEDGQVRGTSGSTLRGRVTQRYLYVAVRKESDNSVRPRSLHRLVALAFVPNPDNKPQVNHKDGDKLNNAAGNLEWVTCAENIRHAHALGLCYTPHGEANGYARLNSEAVKVLRSIRRGRMKLACRLYGISYGHGRALGKGLWWKHV